MLIRPILLSDKSLRAVMRITGKDGEEMIQGKVEICGVNTSKLPLLKNAEKEELFKRISDGDIDARKEYINGNLRLVLSVIKRFHSSNENVDDLFQIGCIGLIKAIDNFDSTLNVKFSTYAVPMNITCREMLGRVKMTRKQAISKAIQLLSVNHENDDIIYKLKEIEDELPMPVWTKKSIIDAIETYASEHNDTLPPVADLTNANKLPSNTVITNLFKLSSMNDFYYQYLPHLKACNKNSSPYKFYDDNYFIDIFKQNYDRIKKELNISYVNESLYSKLKDGSTPHISTIIRKTGCKSYRDLLILCGYKQKNKKLQSNIQVNYIDTPKRNKELLEILNMLKESKDR